MAAVADDSALIRAMAATVSPGILSQMSALLKALCTHGGDAFVIVVAVEELRPLGQCFPPEWTNKECRFLLDAKARASATETTTPEQTNMHDIINYLCYCTLDVNKLDVDKCGHGVCYWGNMGEKLGSTSALAKYLGGRPQNLQRRITREFSP